MPKYITIERPDGQITAVRSSLDLASESPLTEHEQIINELYQKLNITNNVKCDDIEAPYFDKNGKEIKEFAVLKVYHLPTDEEISKADIALFNEYVEKEYAYIGGLFSAGAKWMRDKINKGN